MIGTTRNVRVFAYARPADLRKGFDGLFGMVTRELGRDPLSGDCYLFVNRNRRRAKVLLYDGTGLCIFAKRLEQNTFACLWKSERLADDASSLELTMSELALFIEGCEIVARKSLSPRVVVPTTLEQRAAV